MKKKRVLKRKFKYFFGFYFILVFLTLISTSFSKYKTTSDTNTNVKIAKMIVEIENDSSASDIVVGSSVTRYFSISNFNEEGTTDVAFDYYIYIVNEQNEIIDDAKIYYQIEKDNPNEFSLLDKITTGNYSGYFQTQGFSTTKESHNYKLVVDCVSDYNTIEIKVEAIQKKVN